MRADVEKGGLVGVGSGSSLKIFQKYFDFFLFSPSVCREADTSLVKERLTKQNLDGEISS